jgi:hypothetical protein
MTDPLSHLDTSGVVAEFVNAFWSSPDEENDSNYAKIVAHPFYGKDYMITTRQITLIHKPWIEEKAVIRGLNWLVSRLNLNLKQTCPNGERLIDVLLWKALRQFPSSDFVLVKYLSTLGATFSQTTIAHQKYICSGDVYKLFFCIQKGFFVSKDIIEAFILNEIRSGFISTIEFLVLTIEPDVTQILRTLRQKIVADKEQNALFMRPKTSLLAADIAELRKGSHSQKEYHDYGEWFDELTVPITDSMRVLFLDSCTRFMDREKRDRMIREKRLEKQCSTESYLIPYPAIPVVTEITRVDVTSQAKLAISTPCTTEPFVTMTEEVAILTPLDKVRIVCRQINIALAARRATTQDADPNFENMQKTCMKLISICKKYAKGLKLMSEARVLCRQMIVELTEIREVTPDFDPELENIEKACMKIMLILGKESDSPVVSTDHTIDPGIEGNAFEDALVTVLTRAFIAFTVRNETQNKEWIPGVGNKFDVSIETPTHVILAQIKWKCRVTASDFTPFKSAFDIANTGVGKTKIPLFITRCNPTTDATLHIGDICVISGEALCTSVADPIWDRTIRAVVDKISAITGASSISVSLPVHAPVSERPSIARFIEQEYAVFWSDFQNMGNSIRDASLITIHNEISRGKSFDKVMPFIRETLIKSNLDRNFKQQLFSMRSHIDNIVAADMSMVPRDDPALKLYNVVKKTKRIVFTAEQDQFLHQCCFPSRENKKVSESGKDISATMRRKVFVGILMKV